MAIIYSYPVASAVEAGDLLIGTDITGKQTKNFSIGSIVAAGIPAHISGTTNTVPLFTGSNTIGDSIITQSASKIGIGTSGTSPADKLHVQGTVRAVVADSSGAAFNAINASGVSSTFRFDNNHAVLALKNNSNVVTTKISSDGFSHFTGGNVGFGTTTPQAPVDIVASVENSGLLLSNVGDNSDYDSVRFTYSGFNAGSPEFIFTPKTQPSAGLTNTFFRFKTNGGASIANVANVSIDGKLGVGTTTPLANLDVKETTTNVAGQIIVGGLIESSTDDKPFGKLCFANTANANSQPNKILASIEGRKNGSSNRGILTFGVADGSGSNWEKMRIDSYGGVSIGEDNVLSESKLSVFKTNDMLTATPHIATFSDSLSNHSANLWPSPGDNNADIYGGVSRATFTGSGTVDQIIGINPVGRHSGSGSVNFIQGVQATAGLTGAGSAEQIVASFAKVDIKGTASSNVVDAISGFNVLELNGSNIVQNVYGTYSNLFLTEGEVSNNAVGHFIDFDQVSATTTINNAYYIHAQNDSLSVSGEKLFIKDTTGLNSEFGASLTVADSLEVGVNAQATGDNSIATGNNSIAQGNNSIAMGFNTTASGESSTAIGFSTEASAPGSFAGGGGFDQVQFPGGNASGNSSFAFGIDAVASNAGSIAIGSNTDATGSNSVAIGNNSRATRSNSFAAGVGNLASGLSSTALGSVTVASGSNSFACGDNTTASGAISFAAGKGTIASGDGSIAMGGIGTGTSTASGQASAVFGGLQNNARGENSTILGGQKNNIDVNSSDSGIIGGEDNEMTAGSTNSILLGGIGLRGGGINQTVVGVANVSRNDAKFIVGVGDYTDPNTITRENAFVVKDNGQIILDQYINNDFAANNYLFPVLNVDGTGRINKGNLADMLPNIPLEMSNSAFTFQDGTNVNLGSSTRGIVKASWNVTGSNNPATITLPQSSNNLNKLITVVTTASFGNVASTNILGIKPAFGDTINDTTAPNNVIELDKAYESAEFYATSDGWIMLRKTII